MARPLEIAALKMLKIIVIILMVAKISNNVNYSYDINYNSSNSISDDNKSH